jgi:dienelactone hydrolase
VRAHPESLLGAAPAPAAAAAARVDGTSDLRWWRPLGAPLQPSGGGVSSLDASSSASVAGSGSDDERELAKIQAPVYGFYGGNDARVNATLPKSELLMKKAGKVFEPVLYEGAGHGFMRAGEDPAGSPENKKARETAWQRLKQLLKGL